MAAQEPQPVLQAAGQPAHRHLQPAAGRQPGALMLRAVNLCRTAPLECSGASVGPTPCDGAFDEFYPVDRRVRRRVADPGPDLLVPALDAGDHLGGVPAAGHRHRPAGAGPVAPGPGPRRRLAQAPDRSRVAVLAVNDAQDHDPLRFGLSGEAGLNDGVAFPFVLLGLLLVQGQAVDSSALFTWLWRDLLWAMPVGLLVGYWMGKLLGRLTLTLRISHADSTLTPNDYLALALIALAYVVADTLHAYGFLAVFAAGLGLRQAEVS
uniref:Na_H_Exchanger domain-containing protein n=1 Tax=Steinernema glaseri TaxID=37863 RepID=A0A1I8AP12_9BILA